MKYEVKSVGIWSVAKISFVIYGVLGFVVGIFYAGFLSLFAGLFRMAGQEEMPAIFTGVAFVFLPVIFAFLGAIIGLIQNGLAAVLYNLFARGVGGIEINLSGTGGSEPQAYGGVQPIYSAPSVTPSQPPTGFQTGAPPYPPPSSGPAV